MKTSTLFKRTEQRAGDDYIVVIGAGVMGTCITTMALGHGAPVLLIDTDMNKIDRSCTEIRTQLRHGRLLSKFPPGVAAGQLAVGNKIELAGRAVAVVEAITENRKLKQMVLQEVQAQVEPTTPLITNTSGIPIDELATSLRRPEDLVGAHFMNPAYLIGMVEVIRGPRTAEVTLDAVGNLLKSLNRQMIVVRDSPGFVTSRLLHPMINDAARLVEEGVATVETVDSLMVGCLGHAVGPLRTADLIGIDNLIDSLDALHERTAEERYKPCSLLLDKKANGHLGRKTDQGFYKYSAGVM
ncbi:putative 3-hydroxybutyryl-CoA dehydrogenase [Mycobacterium basiliense]|uniref:Putative 3-hydroxybutyryl-CoA dehydrogenase n=1 Tax=Mycobacterium basiliense TaxID=2094119 RepID=A0A447GFC5_9MYCO|nr:3-hydroxyacyl-CoA dehydrogenase family protein [Mycobacterium basiliense]VDM89182.1 putative 3-hydroxybutyryl-CoA dehydrogenase [Mycobacterium basiliense]